MTKYFNFVKVYSQSNRNVGLPNRLESYNINKNKKYAKIIKTLNHFANSFENQAETNNHNENKEDFENKEDIMISNECINVKIETDNSDDDDDLLFNLSPDKSFYEISKKKLN